MSKSEDETKFGRPTPDGQKLTNTNSERIEAVSDETYPTTVDKAGQLLEEAGHNVIITPLDNKRILRKIDLAILPILLVVYCLQFLDKGQSLHRH